MAHLNGPAAFVTMLIVTACASPTASIQPTSGSTLQPTSQPTPTLQPTPTHLFTDAPIPSQPATVTLAPTDASPSLAWRKRTDIAAGPSAREDHTWTVDRDGAMAYLFGGRGSSGPSNELWEFNLATDAWTLLQPSGDRPAERFGHTATWVPDVGLVIWSGQGVGFFDDVLAYEPVANVWRELPSLGAVPAARYGSCASLGPDGELWISHGFTEDSGRFADTRSYDFATGAWTDRTPVGQVPVERCLHDCFWSTGGQLILYGGQTTGVAALGDIWAYDLITGAWSRGPESEAPARHLYAQANDGRTAFIFGGGSLDGGFLADTWRLDGQALALAPFDPQTPAPSPRSGAAMILDPSHARALLFGGKDAAGVLADTWDFFTST